MKTFKCFAVISFVLLFSGCTTTTGPAFECSFAEGAWNPNDWTLVKSPHWDHFGGWIQKQTHIENHTPAGATAADLLSTRAPETYTSMVLKKQFTGDVAISSTMEFTDQMAPLIVITPGLGKDKKGRAEYREHFEVVIYNKGVNVWHHYFKDGKPSMEKVAYSNFTLKPNTKYNVKVEITATPGGKELSVTIGDHKFDYIEGSLPDNFYVGITGCEGINRFYDFTVEAEKGK